MLASGDLSAWRLAAEQPEPVLRILGEPFCHLPLPVSFWPLPCLILLPGMRHAHHRPYY
jgi:hypothetical protein